jgi:hypothetical protein
MRAAKVGTTVEDHDGADEEAVQEVVENDDNVENISKSRAAAKERNRKAKLVAEKKK